MITNAKQTATQRSILENQKLNVSTKQTYMMLANEVVSNKTVTDRQKDQIKTNWHKKQINRSKNAKERKVNDERFEGYILELQKEAQEFEDLKKGIRQM